MGDDGEHDINRFGDLASQHERVKGLCGVYL
jgi:hypothetical protein